MTASSATRRAHAAAVPVWIFTNAMTMLNSDVTGGFAGLSPSPSAWNSSGRFGCKVEAALLAVCMAQGGVGVGKHDACHAPSGQSACSTASALQ